MKNACTECKEIYDPIAQATVSNAWVDKKGVAHFEYTCPDCGSTQELEIIWK